MSDIYSSPENYGLKQIAMMEDAEASYSFDYFIVWQHEDGKVYWAQDSGCSCPSPFESYHSVADLNNVHAGSIGDFEREVEGYDYGSPTEKAEIIKTVKALVAA